MDSQSPNRTERHTDTQTGATESITTAAFADGKAAFDVSRSGFLSSDKLFVMIYAINI